MRAFLLGLWNATSWAVRSIVVLGLAVLGLALALAFSGGSSKTAAVVTTTTTAAAPMITTPTTTTSTTVSTPTTTVSNGSGATQTSGGSINGNGGNQGADNEECDGVQAGPSGLAAIVHFGPGPLISGGTIPVGIKVCRVAASQKEAANFLVAFGAGPAGVPPTDFASLSFQGGGVYRLFQDNWFILPDLQVGQVWHLPATLKVPMQEAGTSSLCIWATFGALGGAPSYDKGGNEVPDWKIPATAPARCKTYAG